MNYKKNKTQKLGFSLLELSVVLLVISILMAAVIKGSSLIDEAKLSSAQQKTANSPVFDINGLAVWYETTLNESFDNREADDGSAILTWNDISGNNPNSPNNAVIDTTITCPSLACDNASPTYISGAINGLPVVRFDGIANYLSYNGTFLANSEYTIFVVEQRGAGGEQNFLGGSAIANNANLHFGYVNDTTATLDHFSGNSYQYTSATIIPAYTSPIPRIHSYRAGLPDPTGSKNYYINGANTFTVNCAAAPCDGTTPLSSYAGASIGRYVGTFYNGDVAEVIMFTRYLSDQERQDVEAYLSSKYDIPLQ